MQTESSERTEIIQKSKEFLLTMQRYSVRIEFEQRLFEAGKPKKFILPKHMWSSENF